MWNIFKKEFWAFLNTPTGNIIVGLFLLAIALFLWVIPGEYNVLTTDNLDGLFYMAPWFFCFCVRLLPCACCRRISAGHGRVVTNSSHQPLSIVLGKFCRMGIVLIALIPTLCGILVLAEPFEMLIWGILGRFIVCYYRQFILLLACLRLL